MNGLCVSRHALGCYNGFFAPNSKRNADVAQRLPHFGNIDNLFADCPLCAKRCPLARSNPTSALPSESRLDSDVAACPKVPISDSCAAANNDLFCFFNGGASAIQRLRHKKASLSSFMEATGARRCRTMPGCDLGLLRFFDMLAKR
jgi:hypothetical protein